MKSYLLNFHFPLSLYFHWHFSVAHVFTFFTNCLVPANVKKSCKYIHFAVRSERGLRERTSAVARMRRKQTAQNRIIAIRIELWIMNIIYSLFKCLLLDINCDMSKCNPTYTCIFMIAVTMLSWVIQPYYLKWVKCVFLLAVQMQSDFYFLFSFLIQWFYLWFRVLML